MGFPLRLAILSIIDINMDSHKSPPFFPGRSEKLWPPHCFAWPGRRKVDVRRISDYLLIKMPYIYLIYLWFYFKKYLIHFDGLPGVLTIGGHQRKKP